MSWIRRVLASVAIHGTTGLPSMALAPLAKGDSAGCCGVWLERRRDDLRRSRRAVDIG
jgi:hypothetical protein